MPRLVDPSYVLSLRPVAQWSRVLFVYLLSQSHKKRCSDKKKFSSISTHLFTKLAEFYFGKGTFFLLK